MATDMMRAVRDSLPTTDDVLHAVGLEYQRSAAMSALSTVAAFALGTLVGAALTTFYTSTAGQELRRDLQDRARGLGERMGWSGRQADDQAAAH